MGKIDKSTLDNIKSNLNSTGIFLENYVYNFLKTNKTQYGAKREVSYNIIDAGGFIEGECDIVASSNISENKVVCFFVECKRASADDKYWVFEKGPMVPTPFMTLKLLGDNPEYRHDLHLSALNYNRPEDYEAAINIFEFDEKSGKRNTSIQRRERPFLALRHANEAFSGLAKDSLAALDIAHNTKANEGMKILFLPLVVTTATLLMPTYNTEDIDYSKGTIDTDKIELDKKGWVHFEFPLTGALNNNFTEYKKRSTFIVNVNSLYDFINGVTIAAKTYM